MNILLWVLQILLALHTFMGALWKFSNSEHAVTHLQGIPHGIWLTMGVVELLCALGLIFPALMKRLTSLIPIAALFIVSEMLFYIGLNLFSGDADYSHVIYWLVVAFIGGFVAYGRFVLKPL